MTDYITRTGLRPETRVLAMVSAVWMPRLITFAIREGLFDLVGSGPCHAASVASKTGLASGAVGRLMQGLVDLGLMKFDKGLFSLTQEGELLTARSPSGMAAMAKVWDGLFDGAWRHLSTTARTGQPGFDAHHGVPIFQALRDDPVLARTFDEAMNGFASLTAPEAVRLLAGRDLKSICDVGGGNGLLLDRILTALPDVEGILFETPGAAAAVRAEVKNDRLHVVGGDFFESVPAAQAHILSNVLHNWPDADAARILANVARAQGGSGRIFVLEMILDEKDEATLARSIDLGMLVLTRGGRERTRAEFDALLAGAGYRIDRVDGVAGLACLLEASTPAGS